MKIGVTGQISKLKILPANFPTTLLLVIRITIPIILATVFLNYIQIIKIIISCFCFLNYIHLSCLCLCMSALCAMCNLKFYIDKI